MVINMSQDTLNKFITLGLFAFFAVVYIISFLTGKAVDWQTLLVFIVPTLNHIAGQVTSTQITTKKIDATSAQAVAQTQAGGNGTPSNPVLPTP